MSASLERRHVIVRGRVQGVGFRAFVEARALTLGLAGWVRNRKDGTVEAVFEGPPDGVAAMLEACRAGPRSSQVTDLKVRDPSETEQSQVGASFTLLPTA